MEKRRGPARVEFPHPGGRLWFRPGSATIDYQWWVAELIEGSGGALDEDGLYTEHVSEDGGDPTLEVGPNRLLFGNGCFLLFEFVVKQTEFFPLTFFRFHFQCFDEMIWRKDKHSGHEHEKGMSGREEHIHIPYRSDPNYRFPFEPVDLQEVIAEVHDHYAGVVLTPRTLPTIVRALQPKSQFGEAT